MQRIISSLLLVFAITTITFAQDFDGFWVGEIPIFDNELPYTLEVELEQNGNILTGASRIYHPYTTNYAVMLLEGEVDGDQIILREYDVVDSRVLPNTNIGGGWYLKRLEGTLQMDEEKEEFVINGRWTADKAWDHIGMQLNRGVLARPGVFNLRKVDPSEISAANE